MNVKEKCKAINNIYDGLLKAHKDLITLREHITIIINNDEKDLIKFKLYLMKLLIADAEQICTDLNSMSTPIKELYNDILTIYNLID